MKKVIAILVVFSISVFSQTIKVGMDPSNPPFEFINDDKISGFDVDFLAEVSKRAGFSYEIVSSGYDEMCNNVNEKVLDIGISAFGLDELTAGCDYSDSYYDSNLVFLRVQGNTKVGGSDENSTLASLAGKKIGFLDSDYVKGIVNGLGATPVERNNEVVALALLLKLGQVDALIVDSTNLPVILKEDYSQINDTHKAQVEMIQSMGLNLPLEVFYKASSQESDTVVLFPKDGSLEWLKEKMNAAIQSMKKDGFLTRLAAKYSL